MRTPRPLPVTVCFLMIAGPSVVASGAHAQEYERYEVTAPDGVTLSVQEWGNPDGPAILFVHGYAQSHMNWQEQVRDAELAKEFRMITFDLRGHGMSDKPRDAAYYQEGERWSGDVASILERLEVTDPVIVASSMGGRVVGDYVVHYGHETLGGVVGVGAILLDDATRWFGPATRHFKPMASADIPTAIAAIERFVDSFFVTAPPEDELRTMLAYNLMTAREFRVAIFGRDPTEHERHWRDLDVPVLLVHGMDDQVIDPGMSETAALVMEHAQTSFMDGIGHLPFLEAPEEFNAELAEFVRQAAER